MSAGGKLLLLEMVMPGRAAPHIGMMIDVEMLVTLGDRERTRAEYADLLGPVGPRQLPPHPGDSHRQPNVDQRGGPHLVESAESARENAITGMRLHVADFW
jgi:hypothetical protein